MMLKLFIFRKKKLFERMFIFEQGLINYVRWYRIPDLNALINGRLLQF